MEKETALKIITSGEGNQNVGLLVDQAKAIGTNLARQLTTSQIRNIFGEVRRIEMGWSKDPQGSFRQTVLLRPKLAYLAKKERGKGVEDLQQVLDPCIALIQDAPDEAERKVRFERFVDFFEAILAYHKAGGGN